MMNKLLNKICIGAAVLCSASVISSCTAGLTYEEAPESVYSEVGVSKIELKARELFNDKIYAVNWNKWVDNYIDTRLIGSSDVFTCSLVQTRTNFLRIHTMYLKWHDQLR